MYERKGKVILHKGKWYGYITFDEDMLNWMNVQTLDQLDNEAQKLKSLMEDDVIITSVLLEKPLPVAYERMKRLKVLFKRNGEPKQLVIEGVKPTVDRNDVLGVLQSLFGGDVDIVSMVFKG